MCRARSPGRRVGRESEAPSPVGAVCSVLVTPRSLSATSRASSRRSRSRSGALTARWWTRQDYLHAEEDEYDENQQADQCPVEQGRNLCLEARLGHPSLRGDSLWSWTTLHLPSHGDSEHRARPPATNGNAPRARRGSRAGGHACLDPAIDAGFRVVRGTGRRAPLAARREDEPRGGRAGCAFCASTVTVLQPGGCRVRALSDLHTPADRLPRAGAGP
jgi:hypothetical protein